MKETQLIAVPSESPGGLNVNPSAHFGHADVFTVVRITAGTPHDITILKNNGHSDCQGPVNLLRDNDVDVLVVGGIGARPLAACHEAGIAVYQAGKGVVGEVIADYLTGQLPVLDPARSCQGGGCH